MKKLRVVAKVYDTAKCEYVQRYSEIPVSDEVVKGIFEAMNSDGPCPIVSHGHGDSTGKLENISSPLRDQSRFILNANLRIIDVDEETGAEKEIGGWTAM